ncbi:MAG: MYXO-CTERM sorting domain-containing protein [Deltaproteobacteria bacterium]|nr:MYXO-CTERM sorting domain-containing protein [Deltaproteobacteria bacterium]
MRRTGTSEAGGQRRQHKTDLVTRGRPPCGIAGRLGASFAAAAVLGALTLGGAVSRAQTFDERRAAYLANPDRYSHCGESIWGWLEAGTRAEQVHWLIQAWLRPNTPPESPPPEGSPRDLDSCWTWHLHYDIPSILLIRVLRQYGDRISPEDRADIERRYYDMLRDIYYFHHGSLNNRLFVFVGRYLASEDDPDVTVDYPAFPALDTFTWEGRTYEPGNPYNSLAISRDWLLWKMDLLVTVGDKDNELDAKYTPPIIASLLTLADLARDEEMRNRARMTLDLLLLDSILDVSVERHGGRIGRTYGQFVLAGYPRIYHWPFWGIGGDPVVDIEAQYLLVWAGTYRLPALIEDLGVLDDEPETYWHLNREQNWAGGPDKQTFVTPFYNLGGGDGLWMLNVGGSDGRAFRLWINEQETVPVCTGSDCYIELGHYGYQHRNAMLVTNVPTAYVHPDNVLDNFDSHESASGWEIYREGRVAMALRSVGDIAGLEVITVGVDYPTYEDFTAALAAHARLETAEGTPTFVTSRGTEIRAVYDATLGRVVTEVDGARPWTSPFPRLATVDDQGDPIVSWSGRVMTVERHCQRLTYDFETWTSSETTTCGGADADADAEDDAGGEPDAGADADADTVGPDAGPDGTPDANGDAGDSGGCGCRTASAGGGTGAPVGLLALAALAAARRRNRRRTHECGRTSALRLPR